MQSCKSAVYYNFFLLHQFDQLCSQMKMMLIYLLIIKNNVQQLLFTFLNIMFISSYSFMQ